MTKIINAENLRQYKRRFSLIVEQIMAFASSIKLVSVSKFQTNCMLIFDTINNSHSDR